VSEIAFKFSEMIQEVQTFGAVANKFLDESTSGVLAEYLKQLQFIQSKKSKAAISWGISQNRPLRTTISKGKYEGGTRLGGLEVFATISTQWEISCPDEKSKKNSPQKHFHLTGLASRRPSLFRTSCRICGVEQVH